MGTRGSTISSTATNPSVLPDRVRQRPFVISKHPKMVAINVALEIDLTGQVCSDSLGDEVLLGHRRPGRFQPRRSPSHRRQGDHRPALDDPGREVSRIVRPAQSGRRRGDHARRRPLRGHRVRRGLPARQERPGAGHGLDLHRPSRFSRASCSGRRSTASTSARKCRSWKARSSSGRQELQTSMLLDDGTQVNFRPIHPTDEPGMRDLFYALSQETIYYRFMAPMKRFSEKQIQDFVYIDHRNEVAIVGTLPEAHGEEIIAVGRYYPQSEDQQGGGGLRGPRRVAEPRHRQLPAQVPESPSPGATASAASPPRCCATTRPCRRCSIEPTGM